MLSGMGGPVTLAETNWTMLLLFAGCLLLLRKTKLSPILIMVRAGVINVVKAVLAGERAAENLIDFFHMP